MEAPGAEVEIEKDIYDAKSKKTFNYAQISEQFYRITNNDERNSIKKYKISNKVKYL